MFIIIQALETLDDQQKRDPIYIQMGHVLKRAGVSITVTSLTDVAAFAIGATTVCDEYSVFYIVTLSFLLQVRHGLFKVILWQAFSLN